MCAIFGFYGQVSEPNLILKKMSRELLHRGPDYQGLYIDKDVGLGHNRLAVIDLSQSGNQPMTYSDEGLVITFNGEIFNYKELREELKGEIFKTQTDTEVLLKAFKVWGAKCLNKLIGMFSFVIWNKKTRKMFFARDRFGIKPLYYSVQKECIFFSSEIKGLFAAGVLKNSNLKTWSTYLSYGIYEHSKNTFYDNINQITPGQYMIIDQNRGLSKKTYYDLSNLKDSIKEHKNSSSLVIEEYSELLRNSLILSCRSDVHLGIAISGGLDSSVLLSYLNEINDNNDYISAFTYTCGQNPYDETPWVKKILSSYNHPWHVSKTLAHELPDLINKVTINQEEPFGGFNTVCLSQLCMNAKSNNVTVLLDGNGLDEQWGGYEYYTKKSWSKHEYNTGPVQASTSDSIKSDCLDKEFLRKAEKLDFPKPFNTMLDNLRYRDLVFTKIPRALRFSDRASMMHSRELRIPFLDHRLVEYSFEINNSLLISNYKQKYLLRKMMNKKIPDNILNSSKRPLHTPQREWLAEDLSDYVDDLLYSKKLKELGWFNYKNLINEWERFKNIKSDNSFYVWQWISTSLIAT